MYGDQMIFLNRMVLFILWLVIMPCRSAWRSRLQCNSKFVNLISSPNGIMAHWQWIIVSAWSSAKYAGDILCLRFTSGLDIYLLLYMKMTGRCGITNHMITRNSCRFLRLSKNPVWIHVSGQFNCALLLTMLGIKQTYNIIYMVTASTMTNKIQAGHGIPWLSVFVWPLFKLMFRVRDILLP